MLSLHDRVLVARLYALIGKQCAVEKDHARAAECLWRSDQLWELLEVLDEMRDDKGVERLMHVARSEGDAYLQVCAVCVLLLLLLLFCACVSLCVDDFREEKRG